jgi:fructokinase
VTYGGIEAGGTKWVCAAAPSPAELGETVTIPTTTPGETIGRAAAFFDGRDPVALGVGSFGPIDLRRSSPTWGHITTTPKPGWAHVDVVGALVEALGVPVGFDTDVNAAALGEHRQGAAKGLDTFCYITVGTGIGGGAMAEGRLVHGLLHPELGHMRVPHDHDRDPFAGICPFHGDCLEGLASGEAIRARWNRAGEELHGEPAVWELEADYLALGLVNVICTISPQRIVVGGGVVETPGLLPLVRARVRDLLAGYVAVPELTEDLDSYIVPPALGRLAGVVGALVLAEQAAGVREAERAR